MSTADRNSTIAYLMNQYPKISHTFIRREIEAMERRGITVERFSIERTTTELADPADREELLRTRSVLSVGLAGLFVATILTAVKQPIRFCRVLAWALKLGIRSDRGILRHGIYFAEACLLLRWFQQRNISHVHAHFGTNPAMVVLLCRVLGGPTYSFTSHGAAEFDQLGYLAIDEKVTHAKAAVLVSQYGRSQIMRWVNPDHWKKLHVIHCGVSQDFLETDPVRVPNAPTLVCVGRLSEEKGQLVLLEAASQLKTRGKSFQLVFVGDGEFRATIESLIAQLNLEDRVTLVGWANEQQIMDNLREARAMVLPSFTEGLPVVIMEAFALARPVISTFVAGIPELVIPGENGWLVPAGTVEPLASAMNEVLEMSPEELFEMGLVGRRRVIEEFNVEVEAAKLAKLLDLP